MHTRSRGWYAARAIGTFILLVGVLATPSFALPECSDCTCFMSCQNRCIVHEEDGWWHIETCLSWQCEDNCNQEMASGFSQSPTATAILTEGGSCVASVLQPDAPIAEHEAQRLGITDRN